MSLWGRQLAAFSKQFREDASKKYRAAILEVTIGTILDTPVLEGRLRGDWEVSIGVTKPEQRDVIDPTGMATINAVTAAIRGVDIEEDVYFSNRLPYAAVIEYNGHSKKAPEGMLRRNMVKWKGSLENI